MDSRKHARRLLVAAAISSLSQAPAFAQAPPEAAAPDGALRAGGIWKAAVPSTPMKGEFDNFDPVGIAVGARIKADCSINWIDPDDGARYCFSSGTSLEYFLDRPHASIERARAGWRKLTGTPQRPAQTPKESATM
jgi:hypothetical protein